MTLDLTLQIDRYQDDTRVDPGGTVAHYRLVIFRLGKFGPFVERFARETFTDADLTQRVSLLRQQLEAIHR